MIAARADLTPCPPCSLCWRAEPRSPRRSARSAGSAARSSSSRSSCCSASSRRSPPPSGSCRWRAGSLAAAPAQLDDGRGAPPPGRHARDHGQRRCDRRRAAGRRHRPQSVLARLLAVVARGRRDRGRPHAGPAQPARAGVRRSRTRASGRARCGRLPAAATTSSPTRPSGVPAGLAAMVVAGVVSGLAGVGGGFIKTPVMSEIMHVPVKVAAATSTFTVGHHREPRAARLHRPGSHRVPGGRRGRGRRPASAAPSAARLQRRLAPTSRPGVAEIA